MSAVRRHVWVSGRVQGVWFRYHTQEAAQRLGVTGWVRNLPDGRVEAVFEGDESAVSAVVAWCRRGPSAARVSGVEVRVEEPTGNEGFEVTG